MATPLGRRDENWKNDETFHLLNIYKVNRFPIQKKLRNTGVYQIMSAELLKHGFQRTASQIAKKIQNLNKRYREEKIKVHMAGETSTWRFYDKVAEIAETMDDDTRDDTTSVILLENEFNMLKNSMDIVIPEQEYVNPTNDNSSPKIVMLTSGDISIPVGDIVQTEDTSNVKEASKETPTYKVVNLPMTNMLQLLPSTTPNNGKKTESIPQRKQVTSETQTTNLPVLKILQPGASNSTSTTEHQEIPENAENSSCRSKSRKRDFSMITEMLEEFWDSRQEQKQCTNEMLALTKESVLNQRKIIALLEEQNKILKCFK